MIHIIKKTPIDFIVIIIINKFKHIFNTYRLYQVFDSSYKLSLFIMI